MPVLAAQHTAAGAAAFAKFFILTIDWAYATTSTTYMRHYFETTCVACRSVADGVDKTRRAGHHFIGDRFTIRNVRTVNGSTTLITFDVSSTEVVDATGKFINGGVALVGYRERIQSLWRGAGWRVAVMTPLGVKK